ncbi:MAG: hypothetical protein HY423_16410 [Candidatus Lambdaproteobacteria bacterium]|nr:hypothetical protein [Candidatus Lambdaproteobacteria bacterium]
MSRTFQVVTLHPSLAEWAGPAGREGEPGPGRSWFPAADEGDAAVALPRILETLAAEQALPDAPLVIILPTAEARVRRLEFPFAEPRKIALALPFALEDELLESLDELAYDHALLPGDGPATTVFVALMARPLVERVLEACRGHRLAPFRLTFAAQALHATRPAPSPRHYQVYAGAEECFVSYVEREALHAVKPLGAVFARWLGERPAAGWSSPAAALAAGLRQPAEGAGTAGAWSALQGELGALCGELNRFIQTHALGQTHTVSLHGLFAPLLRQDQATGLVAPAPVPPAIPPARRFYGVMDELTADADGALALRGIDLLPRGKGLLGRLAEARRPLALAAVLLTLLLGVAATGLGLRFQALRGRTAQAQAALELRLARAAPGQRPVPASLRLLEERVQLLRKQNQASARFATYHYDALTFLRTVSEVYKGFPNLTLESLTLTPDRLVLSGTTDSYEASELLRKRLEAVPGAGKSPQVTQQKAGQTLRYRIVQER